LAASGAHRRKGVALAPSALRGRPVESRRIRADTRTRMAMDGSSEPLGEEDDYVEAQVLDAVRMVPSGNQLFMTMANGREVEVIHVNPTAGRLLYHSGTPTIFLRMAHDKELLLPIVVGEVAVGLLMKAVREEHGQQSRPNHYELMQQLVKVMQFEVRDVRVTQRVVDTYYARIFLAKPGSNEMVSVDARPSDAINLAVRCKVPILVSRSIVVNDAVRLAADPAQFGGRSVRARNAISDPAMDRALEGPDSTAEEMALVAQLMAAVEREEYATAANIRDMLANFRQSTKRQLNKH